MKSKNNKIKINVSLIFLFACITTTTGITAQKLQQPPEIITCFNIIDEQGRPLNLDGVQPAEIVIQCTGSYRNNIYPLTDLRIQKLENIYEYDYLATQPKEIISPFTKRYIYHSGRDFRDLEILVLRLTDEKDDTMRIIFAGLNNFGNPNEPVAFIIDDIRFRKGSYVVNFEKNMVKKKRITFNKFLPLNAYYIKSRLEIKKPVSVTPTVLKDYTINGFTFYNDSLFDYSEPTGNYPPGSVVGHGIYRLDKGTISLRYATIPGYNKNLVIARDSIAGCCKIKCKVFDKYNQPLAGAYIIVKGSATGTSTREDGTGGLNLANENFPLQIIIGMAGYGSREIVLDKAVSYDVKYTFTDNDVYIKPGNIETGIFTDLTKNCVGIYWIKDNSERFSSQNQGQMDDRRIYFKREIRQPIRIITD